MNLFHKSTCLVAALLASTSLLIGCERETRDDDDVIARERDIDVDGDEVTTKETTVRKRPDGNIEVEKKTTEKEYNDGEVETRTKSRRETFPN